LLILSRNDQIVLFERIWNRLRLVIFHFSSDFGHFDDITDRNPTADLERFEPRFLEYDFSFRIQVGAGKLSE